MKQIGIETFQDCTSLKNITIPDGVTEIGMYAFERSGLTSISIPKSVKTIDHEAFANCKDLKNITLSDGLTHVESDVYTDSNIMM